MPGPTNAIFTLRGEGIPEDCQVFAYRAVEELSAPYTVQVDFATFDESVDVRKYLRQRLLLQVINERHESRFFDGIVESAEFLAFVGKRFQFRVTLAPTFSMLKHRESSRIFQEKSVPDIIKQVFSDAGIAEQCKWELAASYEPREYTVQYRESAFNFVSRLLEDEGIFYFFTHDSEGHKMVLADSAAAFEDHDGHFPNEPPVAFSLNAGLFQAAEPLESFSRSRALRTTSVALRDFDFKNPKVKPEAAIPAEDNWPMPYYEYASGFSKGAEGTRKATARISALRQDAETAKGRSSAIALHCGGLCTVEGCAEEEAGGSFVITHLVSQGLQKHSTEETNFACKNEFSGIVLGSPFAPRRRARLPKICGLQTAVVTGGESDDQSIHVDEFGRVKVRFYWDRVGQYDDQSSCWLRVNQVPMGGSMILPRLGWEVSVVFLEGNPDKPIVVGRVYNAENSPPMALPASKASGSLKSMSSPGGGGCNEITMGDSGGSQGFGIKAQKDLNIQVGYDCTTDIGVDDEHHINANLSRSVKVDDSTEIGANQGLTVGANSSCSIGGSQSVSVGVNDTSNATANFVENVGGNRDYTVGGNQFTLTNGVQTDVEGDVTRTVGAVDLVVSADGISDNILGNSTATTGGVRAQLVNGTHGETVKGPRTQNVAAAEVHVVKGNYKVSAKVSHTTMVGGISMQKVAGNVSVKAPMISLVGAVGSFKGGKSELKLSGGPITIKGSKISVKGALIKKTAVSLKQA